MLCNPGAATKLEHGCPHLRINLKENKYHLSTTRSLWKLVTWKEDLNITYNKQRRIVFSRKIAWEILDTICFHSQGNHRNHRPCKIKGNNKAIYRRKNKKEADRVKELIQGKKERFTELKH